MHGDTFQPCPSSLAGPGSATPSVAMPPFPFSPFTFSALIERVCACDRLAMLDHGFINDMMFSCFWLCKSGK
jgi:hypothetical protein